MFTTRLFRFLRKRIVLAVLFTLSFCYCVFHWLPDSEEVMSEDVYVQPLNLPSQSFKWHTSWDKTNHSNPKMTSCRNSVQGKVLIADDKGYVCPRHDVLSNGCCNVESSSTNRYHCESCHDNGCCSIYEYCISCCLQPEKRVLLQKILGKASETFNILFASITDHFELCLTKCRTSSQIEGKLCQHLKQNLEKKLMDPVYRQLLFELLGKDFVTKYFSSYTSNSAILDNIRPDEREKKMSEMKTLVKSIIDGAVQKGGPKSDPKLQPDLTAFSGDIKKVIDSDFEDQLSGSKSKKKSLKGDMPEKYLSELLNFDSHAITYILPTLQSQTVVLSDLLRKQVWSSCILAKEKAKNVRNYEKIKEKFLQLYRKIKESDDSLDSISGVVSQTYKENSCLKTLNTQENTKATATILSICNSHGRKFQAQFVPYAIAMQQVFVKNRNFSDEDFAISSMLTEKVLRLCLVSIENANKITDKVIQEMNEVDKQYFSQINSVLLQLPVQENKPGNPVTSNKKEPSEIASFINKWISSGFVNYLKPHCLLFVWDQLFYHKWENKVIHQICIALLGLLKPWFLQAKQNKDVKNIFTEEPGFLYLLDIRRALMHVQKKGKFSEIPGMNRNIKYDKQEPPAPVIPAKIPTPKPPTPPPPPPPPKMFIPWVPYDKAKVKDVKITKSKLDFPFDLYIDAVRFLPDNSTFIKITGKVLNMYLGQKDKSIKFQAIPELDSPWRYPNFKFKQTINKESTAMNPDVVVMIRVYTLEKHSKKNCVLGSCLFGPFSNKHGKQASLRTGGHQIRVRHGIPDPDFTVEHMLASHMDNNPLIPGVTVLLRVLPHSKDHVSPPEYETNAYRSELAKPNESEERLYKHYKESKDLSKTVRDITLLQMGQASANDELVKQHIQQQLQKEGVDVEDFPYQRYVDYNKDYGMQVLADKASGLPIFLEGRYLQCLVQVFPGEDTKIGNGKNQVTSFITEELELESPQRAPDWSDQPKTIKAEYDDRAFILVSLYGLRPKYDSVKEKVLDKEGKDPSFNLQHAIAWSACSCFEKGSVFAGIHHIPLLRGRPPDEIVEKLSYLPLEYLCKKFKSQVKVFETASIEISVWDGHFINSECPPLPVHTDLLNLSPNPQKCIKAAENPRGTTATDLLKLGLKNPSDYNSVKDKIVEMLKVIFKNNLDIALINAGYSSLA